MSFTIEQSDTLCGLLGNVASLSYFKIDEDARTRTVVPGFQDVVYKFQKKCCGKKYHELALASLCRIVLHYFPGMFYSDDSLPVQTYEQALENLQFLSKTFENLLCEGMGCEADVACAIAAIEGASFYETTVGGVSVVYIPETESLRAEVADLLERLCHCPEKTLFSWFKSVCGSL